MDPSLGLILVELLILSMVGWSRFGQDPLLWLFLSFFIFSLFFSIWYFLENRHCLLLIVLLLFLIKGLSCSFFHWWLRLVFFFIIWVLHLMLVLILRFSSWLTVSDIFILISLRCFHSSYSSILTAFITSLWMFLHVLFNIASHLRCNCLSLVHKATLKLMFRPFGHF